MWNSRKYAAMAIVGAGLAVAAATPASAWWPDYYGAAYGYGGCGYGAAYGYGGCGAYGYAGAGAFAYGWPYATSLGFADYGCGSYYGYAGAGWGGCGGYGYDPTYFGADHYGYGYGYGYGPHHRRGYGSIAYRRGFAAANVPRSHRRVGPRVAVAGYDGIAAKPVQNKTANRADLKLTRAD